MSHWELTRITLPIEIVFWIAVATKVESFLDVGWTVSKRVVPIRDIVKEMNLGLVKHEPCCNRVNRSITPSLVEKAASLIEMVEIVYIFLTSEKVQVANLEI
jgi:hypothetical protein